MITFGSTASDALVSAAAVASDPALPEVLRLVRQLNSIESAKTSSPSAPRPSFSAGVGLSQAITPLKILIYTRQRPWIVPASAVALVFLPLLLGYSIGRRSR